MKKIILTGTFLIVSFLSFSQVRSILSETRIVPTSGIFNSHPPRKTINIQVDSEKALRETKEEEELGLDLPYRFGKGVEVNYTLQNSGDWFEAEGGRVWKLKIKSAKAYSLSFIFSMLKISGQSEIYIYNEKGNMVYGPITSGSISTNGKFSSDIIKGGTLILELFEPNEEKGTSVIHLSRVVHGFRNIFQPTDFGDSNGACQDDVSCNSNWAVQSNGVAMIILANMERLCSGSLLNNACQDFTPNILTAFHCIDIGNDINNINACTNNEVGNGTLTDQEITNAENWIFRFQYKRPNCNSGSEPTNFYTFQQATYRAGWFDTDFALVEMNQNPANGNPETGIRYLGWSRSDVAPTSGSFLGHPQGDVMKISTFGIVTNNDAQLAWTLCSNPLRQVFSPANTHWTTTINNGALEGGSSGGPFFDQNGRVVGQLHGGVIGCSPKVSHAGRFDVSWIGGGTNDTRLSTWLTNDPSVIQTNTIVIPFISGPSLVCSSGASFSLENLPTGATISWSQSTNLSRSSAQGSNPCTFISSYSGTGWIEATITTGCGSVTLPLKTVWVGTPEVNDIVFTNGIDEEGFLCSSHTGNLVSFTSSNYNYFDIRISDVSGTQVLYQYQTSSTEGPLDYSRLTPGYYVFGVRGVNDCGTAEWTETEVEYIDCSQMRSPYYLEFTPNPVITETTVELKRYDKNEVAETIEWEYEVYDMSQNKKYKSYKFHGKKKKLNTNGWQEGIYVVRAVVEEELVSGKFIKK